MERVTSRKNKIISHLRALGTDRQYRRETGLFLCDGEKLLSEAVASGAEIECLLQCEEADLELEADGMTRLCAPLELVQYVSPLKNSAGPVFSVRMSRQRSGGEEKNVFVLENIQDPGNLGNILRTAAAFGIDELLLVGDCADVYNPKTVRATMGAIFRQSVRECDYVNLTEILSAKNLKLCGAVLSDSAGDIRDLQSYENLAFAVGSEGGGLSEKLLSMCENQVFIPMEAGSESLNAAVAASIIMWEIYKSK